MGYPVGFAALTLLTKHSNSRHNLRTTLKHDTIAVAYLGTKVDSGVPSATSSATTTRSCRSTLYHMMRPSRGRRTFQPSQKNEMFAESGWFFPCLLSSDTRIYAFVARKLALSAQLFSASICRMQLLASYRYILA